MARLIDANALKKEVGSTFHGAIGLTVTGAVHEIIDRQPTIDPESLHRERTVATNADCIRSMSDERLADQIVIGVNGLASCKLYLSPPTGRLYRIRTEAVKEVKEWLQQPTEEG